MKFTYKLLFIILLSAGLFSSAYGAENAQREALRADYRAIAEKEYTGVFNVAPSAAAPYEAGEIAVEALSQALETANFIRSLAGLDELQLDEALCEKAQKGAVLLAANEALSHQPGCPEDMAEDFYMEGADAAASSNLAMFNWQAEDLLIEAVLSFARDDGESNLALVGHRRWLLYPGMGKTGFGLAEDAQGRSYAVMYVMDASNEEANYDAVCWPSGGLFPAEFMEKETPWSISLNPDRYDLNRSDPVIELREEQSGAVFLFDGFQENPALPHYLALGGGRYGDGPAYIFRPDLDEYDALMYGYQQNQIWTVRVTGLVCADGSAAEAMTYRVEMFSLTPQDPAAVEVEPRELSLRVGESARLSAQVIPVWADDLGISWRSADETIASVDADGTVQALSQGETEIIAMSVNGREDAVCLTVE